MTQRVLIPSDSVQLEGDLTIPKHATSLVLFAHGSGSSRVSPRNQFVAKALQNAGIGTLLFDPLTEKEAKIAKMFSTSTSSHIVYPRRRVG